MRIADQLMRAVLEERKALLKRMVSLEDRQEWRLGMSEGPLRILAARNEKMFPGAALKFEEKIYADVLLAEPGEVVMGLYGFDIEYRPGTPWPFGKVPKLMELKL